MKSKLIFLLILSNSIFSQKIDSLNYVVHKKRFTEILKNKNKDGFYSELANIVHYNPKINLYEFLSKLQIQQCEEIAKDSSNPFVHSHLNLAIGNSYFIQKNPIQPLGFFLKCEKTFEKTKDTNCQVFCMLRLSSIFSQHSTSNMLNDKYINKAIELAYKSNDSKLIAQSLGYRGARLLDYGQFKSALLVFENIAKLKDIGIRNWFINEFNIGKCYLNLFQKNKGIQIYENTLLKLPPKDESYIDYQIYIRSELIKHYSTIKNMNRIKFHFNEMAYFAKSSKINQYEMDWFKNAEYLVNKELGNYKEALAILEEIKQRKDSLLETQLDLQLEATKAEISAKEKYALSENKRIKSNQEIQNQFWWFLVSLSIMGFLSTLYVIYTNKKLKENIEALKIKNAEVSEALLRGQTTERQRVAIDLHDNLGSTISSIKYSLEAIDRSKMNADEVAVQENLYSLLDKAYNDVRLLSHNLLPEEFEKKGLTETLTEFVRKINKASKIKFELQIDENFGRQNHKIEFELYSICMELVNNIMKHSKATQANITLSKLAPPPGAGGLRLTVSDNGIGTFKNDSDGKGMKNVQARVDSIGGVWRVKAIENEGVVNEIVVNI